MIKVQDLEKTYELGGESIHALAGVDFQIKQGEFVAITGPSGSGKSTLMNILGCLDRPTSGQYELDGLDVSQRSKDELAAIRNQKIGFVFQSFNLLPRMSALENVELPLLYSDQGDTRERCKSVLERVGLSDRMGHQPNELSGGQKQRVAVARALVCDPAILLADEPTGNLDSKTGEEIMQFFEELHGEGRTILIVTHDQEIAQRCRRQIRFRDGKIAEDKSQ